MLQAFVFEDVAVLVFPWSEPVDPPERGTRVEVRLLRAGAPPRFVLRRAAVRDRPAGCSGRICSIRRTRRPATSRSAHFHPNFEGVEPSDRVWPDEIRRDPAGWLAAELADLEQLLARAGYPTVDVGRDDAAALRDAIPAIVAAVEATWTAVRGVPV